MLIHIGHKELYNCGFVLGFNDIAVWLLFFLAIICSGQVLQVYKFLWCTCRTCR